MFYIELNHKPADVGIALIDVCSLWVKSGHQRQDIVQQPIRSRPS
jgi:hypothetical protein